MLFSFLSLQSNKLLLPSYCAGGDSWVISLPMVNGLFPGPSRTAQKLNIYLLPGIGLSANYFDSLTFPAYCSARAIGLPQPGKKETLAGYADRLMQNVETGSPFVLIGMSFGGVLAQEMAEIRQPEAVILLSTIRHSNELPWYFRMGKKAKLSRVLPYRLVGQAIGLVRVLRKKNRLLYDNRTASAGYLAWSLDKMLNWQPTATAVPCFQVHGENDRLLPCRNKKEMFVIRGARHLLLPGNHAALNRITAGIISALPAVR